MYRLVVLSGGPKHAAVLLTEATISVGRDDDNVLQLDDTFVSRHHALLLRQGGHYLVRDLGSSNGTQVNEQPVRETRLQPGDCLRFGGVELQYEVVSVPAEPEPGGDVLLAPPPVHGAGSVTQPLPREWAEVKRLEGELAAARGQLAKARQLPEQLVALRKENEELADALQQQQAAAVGSQQRLAEQAAAELKQLRRELAAARATSFVTDLAGAPSAAEPDHGRPAAARSGELGRWVFVLAALVVLGLAVAGWVASH